MKSRSIARCCLMVLCAGGLLSTMRSVVADDAIAIKNYKTWSCINAQAVHMDPIAATLCRGPMPHELPSVHLDRWIRVYANKVAGTMLVSGKQGTFPVGSVIVKEKLKRATDTQPELLTVMRKREKGYNTACGDWEFSVYSSASLRPETEGKIESCMRCHNKSEVWSDHIFRYPYARLRSKQGSI